MKTVFFCLVFCLFSFTTLLAQTSSDIFVFELEISADKVALRNGKNLTNREGYDNQPHFVEDHALLYTSQRGNQTDIFAYNFLTQSFGNLTQTSTSEYSATLTPDKKSFSVIMVEADGTQRLWKFPLQGGEPELVLDDIKPVGYHAWYNTRLALFVLGNPNTLQVADEITQESRVIAERIGRCLARVPGCGCISFVHKEPGKPWVIKSLEMNTMEITSLIETPEGAEDYVWISPNRLLISKGTKIYHADLSKGTGWVEIADLSSEGIKSLSRMAVDFSGKRLAVVGEM